ncbi:hypothetical protein SOCE26_104970 [Sorangium cellulosum]|uniref:Secreted protein n=1 Tax=Sorangium cellulosum TaxID=56 RepID=A0A2L0FBV3_SORCE|nr:hypothetical protein [Sorangium cellulosum]AUX48952.1 hypothetical protein SOCE26_104970 [Sorangium cellulosum]
MVHAARAATIATLCLALASQAHALDTPPEPEPPGHMRSEVGTTALLLFGMAPATGMDFAPLLTFRWPGISLCFEPRLLVLTSDQPSASGTKKLTVDSTLGTVALCRHRGAVFACGLAQGGRIRADSPDDLLPSDNVAWLLSTGARGGVEWPVLGYLRLYGFVELHLLMARPAIESFAGPWHASPAGMVIGAGVALRGPSR